MLSAVRRVFSRRDFDVVAKHAATVFVGQIAVMGFGVVDTIERGEPPVNPTKILQASLLSENKPRPVISAPAAAPGDTPMM